MKAIYSQGKYSFIFVSSDTFRILDSKSKIQKNQTKNIESENRDKGLIHYHHFGKFVFMSDLHCCF